MKGKPRPVCYFFIIDCSVFFGFGSDRPKSVFKCFVIEQRYQTSPGLHSIRYDDLVYSQLGLYIKHRKSISPSILSPAYGHLQISIRIRIFLSAF